jgi:predicted DNA-binding transcriptional regulator YafY
MPSPLNAVTNWPDEVHIDYTNWKGDRSWRRITPRGIRFGTTDYHPDACWLLDAFDLDKQAMRSFALKDIHEWVEPVPEIYVPEPPATFEPRKLKGRIVHRYERPTYRIEEYADEEEG